MGGIKRTAADRRFSVMIRTRDRWTCQRCFTIYPVGAGGLECAHMFSRACKKCTAKRPRGVPPPDHECTRLDPDNAIALCTGCHFLADGNPYVKESLFRERLGDERFDALEARHNRRRDRVA